MQNSNQMVLARLRRSEPSINVRGNNNVVINQNILADRSTQTFQMRPSEMPRASYWATYDLDRARSFSNEPEVIDDHFNENTRYVNRSNEEALLMAQTKIDRLQRRVRKLESEYKEDNETSQKWRCVVL